MTRSNSIHYRRDHLRRWLLGLLAERPLTHWGAHDRCRWLGVDREDAVFVLGPETPTVRWLTPDDLRDRPTGLIDGSADRLERITAEVHPLLDGVPVRRSAARGLWIPRRSAGLRSTGLDRDGCGDGPGDYQVLLIPACRMIGLNCRSQAERLGRAEWVDRVLTAVTCVDGKAHRMLTVGRAAFQVWLATMDDMRIKDPAARDRAYQYWATPGRPSTRRSGWSHRNPTGCRKGHPPCAVSDPTSAGASPRLNCHSG